MENRCTLSSEAAKVLVNAIPVNLGTSHNIDGFPTSRELTLLEACIVVGLLYFPHEIRDKH